MTGMYWKSARLASGGAAFALAVGMAVTSATMAADAAPESLLKAMSDYMAAQNSISFNYDSNLEIVTVEGQKLGLASSGTIQVSRPDKIRATRTGGFADVELTFDGKTLTLLGKNMNLYAQAELPGTLDKLVDQIRDKYNRPLPAADLIMSNPYQELMADVKDVKDLGSGVIRGQECDHLAFRNDDVDWQIWIAQGDKPYPCRYVITSTKVDRAPQYTIDVRDWNASTEASSVDFRFTPPADAKLATPDDLKDFDELPSHFMPKS
jgi:hypothetical protein